MAPFFSYLSLNKMPFFFNSGQFAVPCEEVKEGCSYRYFVAIDDITDNFTEVHVEYVRGKFLFSHNISVVVII